MTTVPGAAVPNSSSYGGSDPQLPHVWWAVKPICSARGCTTIVIETESDREFKFRKGPIFAQIVLGGLACLLGPEVAVLGTAPLGSLLVLVAAFSWALGSLLLKRFAWTTPTIVLAGWQLLAGGLPVTVGALLLEGIPDPTALTPKAQFALVYTITFPMIFCHWAWFKLIGLFPAAIAAIGTLAIPVVGVFASALLLGEAVGPAEVAALILVCLGLAVVLVGPALIGNRKKKRL